MGQTTVQHMVLDIQGFLETHKRLRDYERLFRDSDDRFMSGFEARNAMRVKLAKGELYLPFGTPCDGFSPVTGCPGHVKAEPTEAAS